MTIESALNSIPHGWRLMCLAQDSQRGFYCCLRTWEPQGEGTWPCAVSFGSSYVEAIQSAVAKAGGK